MAFRDLYEEAQNLPVPVSTKWIKERAIIHSPITRVVETWSGALDGRYLRGCFIEGPMGPPIVIAEHEAQIVLSRHMCKDKHMRRLVLAKELMHCFDTEAEKTDTPDKLDALVSRFFQPRSASSPQFIAESIAFFRALSILCPEGERSALREGRLFRAEVDAARLRLPVAFLGYYLADKFEDLIAEIMD